MPRSRSRSRDRSDRRRSRSRERRRRHRRRRSSSSSSDIASDVYSKMLSKQKRTEKNYGDTDLRKKEREEMEKLRQIRQQEQNEIYIKQQVDKRVALEVGLKVEEEIARRMPEIEKKIAAKIRSEEAATPPADTSDNKLNREQVELINDLKHREVKHVDHIHKLEKEIADMKQRVTDAEEKLAEERLSVVESRRKLEEERASFLKEMESKTKEQQNVILGKKNSAGVKSRPKIAFGIKAKI